MFWMERTHMARDPLRGADFRSGGRWCTKVGLYRLWLEYLAVSPSYELARRYRAGKLTEADTQRLPADFDAVLAVYDDLGDVQRVTFNEWWSDRGLSVFGYEGSRPRVRRVDSLQSKRYRKAANRVQDFIAGDWTEQGQPNALLVSIPIGLTNTQITRQLSKMLTRYRAEYRVLPPHRAKYPLLGTRQRKDTLFRYLFVVLARAALPGFALWRVGARARVSATYSRELDPWAPMLRGAQVYDRSVLAVLTSRAWSRGLALAENAARGRFPDYNPPEHAVEPDIRELWRVIASRRRWSKRQPQNQP
jgi:hypothetical protein